MTSENNTNSTQKERQATLNRWLKSLWVTAMDEVITRHNPSYSIIKRLERIRKRAMQIQLLHETKEACEHLREHIKTEHN